MVQYRAAVTIIRQWEIICTELYYRVSDDLGGWY